MMGAEANLNGTGSVQVGAQTPECLGDRVCTNPRCPRHGIEWGVSDEAVEAGAEAYYDYNRYADAEPAWSVLAARDGDEAAIYRKASRTVLEAALPHLQPQPVASRERVAEVLREHDGYGCGCCAAYDFDKYEDRAEAMADAVFRFLGGAK